MVTGFACDTWPTIAISSDQVTSGIYGSNSVTIARFASIATVNVEIAICTLITVPSNDMGFAATIPGEPITYRQKCLDVNVGADWIALTSLAIGWIPGFFESQGISKKSRFAPIAMKTIGVIDTSETFSGDGITVANGIGINVVITFTFLARFYDPGLTRGITKVSIGTFFTM